MKLESKVNNKRMESCPHFDECSAPKCPLDELMNIRVEYPEDPKCICDKEIRINLAKDMSTHGLFKRELAPIINFWGSWDNYINGKQKAK